MKKIFSTLKRVWMLFAQKLGKFNTILLLSIVYLIVIGLMSLVAKLFRKDLLRKNMNIGSLSYWQIRQSSEQTLERNKFQF
jgi:hypothetical protein